MYAIPSAGQKADGRVGRCPASRHNFQARTFRRFPGSGLQAFPHGLFLWNVAAGFGQDFQCPLQGAVLCTIGEKFRRRFSGGYFFRQSDCGSKCQVLSFAFFHFGLSVGPVFQVQAVDSFGFAVRHEHVFHSGSLS